MGRYDKYFREEPNAKANAQPIKKEPKAKPVTTSRATKVAAPKIKRKNYRKSALRWNGILIFINVCFMLTGIELIALKLLKKYINMDIDQILTQRIGAEDAKKFIIGTIVFGFINFLLLIWHARKRKKIKRSYCPYCGMPHHYCMNDNGFVDSTLFCQFENTFRDEKKETWKGNVEFTCEYCDTDHEVPLTFNTHLGAAVTEQDADVRKAIAKKIFQQFEHKSIHYRKK